jgi:hypothetical protein
MIALFLEKNHTLNRKTLKNTEGPPFNTKIVFFEIKE